MSESGSKKKGSLRELYDIFFSKSWPMWVGGILLGVGNICLFIVLKPWGASGGVKNWGDNLFNLMGGEFANMGAINLFPYSVLCILLIMGAFAGALFSKQFALRFPPLGELFKGLIGGLLMGLGAVVGVSCTIGGFFSGWPALSLGAVVFTLGLVIGTWIAVKYLLFEVNKFPKLSSGKTYSILSAGKGKGSWQPFLGAVVVLIGLIIAFRYTGTSSVLAWYAAIGLFFGMVCQRSRFCVVRALREPFMSGSSVPAVAVMAGILVSMFGFVVIKFMGVRGDMIWVWPHFWVPAIVGGTIFGFGMTIAGGCTVGSLWRAGEGHIKLWASIVGMIVAMPLTAKFIKPAFFDALPDSMKQMFFLPEKIGYGAAVGVFLVIILLWYLFVKWNERTGKFSAY
ncbi:MAG: YeeE/YedE family protein [Candidatus Aegiribacteria sp.]|nr:YeeE/YedE family protein [Candidatus Aegiribacteria sp.]